MKNATVMLSVLLAQAVSAQALLPGEREAAVTAIPGVVAAGAKWELIWADFKTADGIVGTADGGVMFAQEQTDTIRKLTPDGKEYTVIPDTRGAGSISIDAQGRLYAAERTCTEPLNRDLGGCNELTKITQYLPERRVLANSFVSGATLGRVNDVMADGKMRAEMLQRAGRGRITLRVEIYFDQTLATLFEGVFAAAMRR